MRTNKRGNSRNTVYSLLAGTVFVLSSTAFGQINNAVIEASGTWEANGHVYEVWRLVDPFSASFPDVEAFANALDPGMSHLATSTSREENDFIQDLIPGDDYLAPYWLGGIQDPDPGLLDPNGNWHWATGETWDYTDWIDCPPINDHADPI